jgi:hypothetical protein
MGLILLGTALSGVAANRWLLDLGMDRIVVRYPAAVFLSFLAFLILMRLWLTYIHRTFGHPRTISEFDDPESNSPAASKSEKGNWDLSGLDVTPVDDPCGCLLAVLLILVLGIFMMAFSLIAEAPLILAEAAFQFLLAAGLIRSAKKIDRPNWVGSVLSRTWKPFIVIFVATLLLGSCAEMNCKRPTTIKEMIKTCGKD